jgi:hypothetical protein
MGQVVAFPGPAAVARRSFEHDPLSDVVAAANWIVTALGEDAAVSALSGLQGAALTEHEQEAVRPLADALTWLLEGGPRC